MTIVTPAAAIAVRNLVEYSENVAIRRGQNRTAQKFNLMRSLLKLPTVKLSPDGKSSTFTGPLDASELAVARSFNPNDAAWRKGSIFLLESVGAGSYRVIGGHGRHLALLELATLNPAWNDFLVPARVATFTDEADRMTSIIADNDDTSADAGTDLKLTPAARFCAALGVERAKFNANAAYQFNAAGEPIFQSATEPTSTQYSYRYKCGGSERVTLAALTRLALHLDIPATSFNDGNVKANANTAFTLTKSTEANDPTVKMQAHLPKGIETLYVERMKEAAKITDRAKQDTEFEHLKAELRTTMATLLGLKAADWSIDVDIQPWASVGLHVKSKAEREAETEERKARDTAKAEQEIADRARKSYAGAVAEDAVSGKMRIMDAAILKLVYTQLALTPTEQLETIRPYFEGVNIKAPGGPEKALTAAAQFIVPHITQRLTETLAELQLTQAQLAEQKQHREEQHAQQAVAVASAQLPAPKPKSKK